MNSISIINNTDTPEVSTVSTLDGAILDSLDLPVYYIGSDLKVRRWNKAMQELTGYGVGDMPEGNCKGIFLCDIGEASEHLCDNGCPVQASVKDGVPREVPAFVRTKTGVRIPVKVETKPVYLDGGIAGAVAVVYKSDKPKENKENKEKQNGLMYSLTKMALTDKLTGLYNRRYFEGEVRVSLSQINTDKTRRGILFLDIDNFRLFNNTYGHDTGDRILIEMSRAVIAGIRKTDVFCRWGGEEFVGIFEVDSLNGLPILGNKILKAVRELKIRHNGEEIGITVSLGITDARPGDTVESVIQRADKLMYDSKTAGKDRYTIG